MSKNKKKRADVGVYRATERDLYILQYINDMYAIRLNHFAMLFRLYSPSRKVSEGQNLAEITAGVNTLLYRMRSAGWVESKKLEYNKPVWIWLSRSGLVDIESKFKYKQPALAKLAHTHATNGVRLYLQVEHGEHLTWKSERTINRDYWEQTGKRLKHIVDGEVDYKGKKIAIEVELTNKGSERTAKIIRWLMKRYDIIYYYASRSCYNPVKKVIDDVGDDRVILRSIETYINQYESTAKR